MIKKSEFEIYRLKLEDEISALTGEYVKLYVDSTCLDGDFSADELRVIADKMDELKNHLDTVIK